MKRLTKIARITNFKLARVGWVKPASPLTLTFSVTARCQSRCKTCKIWEAYKDHSLHQKDELTLDEIEQIFRSMGRIAFFNVSGGEPFLREDLARIVELALIYLQPDIVHIPTNALLPKRIEETVRDILETMRRLNRVVPLTVKPSLDGVGAKHDEVRGVPGNFDKVVETVGRLKKVSTEYSNFYVEVGTVISKFNMDALDEVADFVHQELGIESYRNEIAEQRAEFFNAADPITPTPKEYKRLIEQFAQKIREHLPEKRLLTKGIECLRLVYYDLAIKIMEQDRQVIPCYGGITNAHLNYDGKLWPCCVLGYDKPLGDLRAANYDFKKVWHSDQARAVRQFIKDKKCACPLANQAYSNILLSPRMMWRVGMNVMGNIFSK